MDTATGPYDPVGRIWISGEKRESDREEHEGKPRDEDVLGQQSCIRGMGGQVRTLVSRSMLEVLGLLSGICSSSKRRIPSNML